MSNFQVHVTPYQISDTNRPWIKKEEEKFSEYLKKSMVTRFKRFVHFATEERSLEKHFQLLEHFV